MRRLLGFILILSFVFVVYQNCSDINLKSKKSPSVQTTPPPLSESLAIPPTVTEGQCTQYLNSRPSYNVGQEPLIYFLCDRLISNVEDKNHFYPTRDLDLKISPETTVDFSHIMGTYALKRRFDSGDQAVQGLQLKWWKNTPNAPELQINPADPLSRFMHTGQGGENYSYSFQFQKGSEAGLIHTLNISVVKAAYSTKPNGDFNCPGFTNTITITPYTDLNADLYHSASHGFIDSNTAVVMKLKAANGFGRIHLDRNFADVENWKIVANLSTTPCDFETNRRTFFQGEIPDFNTYATDVPREQSGAPIASVSNYASYLKLTPGKDYYLNIHSPDCNTVGVTVDGLQQKNCNTNIHINGFSGPASGLVDEWRGVYMVNGVNRAPLFACWNMLGPTAYGNPACPANIQVTRPR